MLKGGGGRDTYHAPGQHPAPPSYHAVCSVSSAFSVVQPAIWWQQTGSSWRESLLIREPDYIRLDLQVVSASATHLHHRVGPRPHKATSTAPVRPLRAVKLQPCRHPAGNPHHHQPTQDGGGGAQPGGGTLVRGGVMLGVPGLQHMPARLHVPGTKGGAHPQTASTIRCCRWVGPARGDGVRVLPPPPPRAGGTCGRSIAPVPRPVAPATALALLL